MSLLLHTKHSFTPFSLPFFSTLLPGTCEKTGSAVGLFYSPLAAPLFARTLAVGYLPWIVLRWVWMLNWTDNGGNISHSKPKDIWWCISWWLTKTENQPSALKKLDLSWNITAAFVTNVCCNICENPFAATFVKILLLQHLWKAFCCNNCEKAFVATFVTSLQAFAATFVTSLQSFGTTFVAILQRGNVCDNTSKGKCLWQKL